MARSHHRPKKHHHPAQHAVASKQKRKATPVFTIFFGVLGLGLGYFATNTIPALIIGGIIGGGIGYLIGYNLDRSGDKG